jgi:hypothetical protein
MDPSLSQPHSKLPKGFILSVLFFTIFMLTVPLGVYLVQQRTNFLPQASTSNQTLETNLSFEAEPQKENGELSVKVLISSDQDGVNLINSQIQFPVESLAVDSIGTDKLEDQVGGARVSRKWIEKKFDNSLGTVSLLLAIPDGLKTEPGKKFEVAVINFKAKSQGPARITFAESSALYKITDNSKVLLPKKDLYLTLAYISSDIKEKRIDCQVKPECLDAKPACQIPEPAEGWCGEDKSSLGLLSPNGGETFSYKSAIPITWESQNVDNIEISLLLNGNLLGKIATASAASKSFSWNPLQTLTYAFIYPFNAFQIQLDSTTPGGEEIIKVSEGPFSISLEDRGPESSGSAKIVNGNGDLNSDRVVDLIDLSILISNFKREQLLNTKADLNGDNLVNDIDIWLLHKEIK